MNDAQLLRAYVENGSQSAFASLVERYAGIVFNTALRRVNGDHRLAEEVTQMAFIELARKARQLVNHPALLAWLHQSTRWNAATALRSRERRAVYEQAAATEALVRSAEAPLVWEKLRPALDEALDQLSDADRDAVLQRYFLNRSFAQIGAALGLTENAARMRVDRALDKLRAPLANKGVRSTAGALALILGEQALSAAPAGLTESIKVATLKQLAIGVGTAAGAGLFTGAKLQLAAASVAIALTVGCALQYQKNRGLAEKLRTLENERTAAQSREKSAADRVDGLRAKWTTAQQVAATTKAAAVPLTPEQQERQRLDTFIRKGELDGDYAPLFRQLKLPAAQLDAFKTLLVERNQAIFDAQRYAKEQDLSELSMAENRALTQTAVADIDPKIAAVIGAEKFQRFVEYEDLAFYRRAVTELAASSVEEYDTPECDQRILRLAKLLSTTAPNFPDEVIRANGWPVDFPSEFVAQASAMLPGTVEKFKNATEANALLRRMFEIAHEAALKGRLQLSKSSQRDYPKPGPDSK